MFYLSRVYVPYSLFRLYRKGIFDETFSAGELRHIVRILIVMHLLDIAGHVALRYMTVEAVGKYVDLNANEFVYKKKQQIDDFIAQKNYFRNKKDK